MSFGKLNILQHKSWNVWNRDNIEKVLKDERELAEKEEQKRQQLMSVESERRTEMLRNRRQKSSDGGTATLESATRSGSIEPLQTDPAQDGQLVLSKGGEIAATGEGRTYKGYDLFEGVAALATSVQGNASATSSGTNREHETEKRKEKEKEHRKWGLVALGQDSFTGESHAQKPWHAHLTPFSIYSSYSRYACDLRYGCRSRLDRQSGG